MNEAVLDMATQSEQLPLHGMEEVPQRGGKMDMLSIHTILEAASLVEDVVVRADPVAGEGGLLERVGGRVLGVGNRGSELVSRSVGIPGWNMERVHTLRSEAHS